MLIPYDTDAPLYHRPFATLGLIGANVVAFVFSIWLTHWFGENAFKLLTLQYNTIYPWQWVTSNFFHAEPIQLTLNMFALWVFGMVVEGKIGPWRMVMVYLGIGVAECMLEQLFGRIFIGEGGSLGASSIIYGFMAIALVWAPRNNVSGVLFFVKIIPFEAPSLLLVINLFILEFATGLFTNMFFGSFALAFVMELLHLLGVGVGLAVGIVMLRTKQVDCEGWDIFSVIRGDHLLQDEIKGNEIFEEQLKSKTEVALASIRKHLQTGHPAMAKCEHVEAKQFIPSWRLPEPEMAALIEGLIQQQRWSDAVEIMVEYLRTHTERAMTVRIALARVCLDHLQRPLQALKVLAKIDRTHLPTATAQEVERLQALALPLAEEDPFEVIHEEW